MTQTAGKAYRICSHCKSWISFLLISLASHWLTSSIDSCLPITTDILLLLVIFAKTDTVSYHPWLFSFMNLKFQLYHEIYIFSTIICCFMLTYLMCFCWSFTRNVTSFNAHSRGNGESGWITVIADNTSSSSSSSSSKHNLNKAHYLVRTVLSAPFQLYQLILKVALSIRCCAYHFINEETDFRKTG